ncbi:MULTISPECIES: LytTR family DNA-binding domain-containing protein [Paenibacillus]|uniref:LytR/AlgR family response regulator transcription factor n=1 Tax=Paenibacillus TaxID=44249 RepID=UPI002FE33AB3
MLSIAICDDQAVECLELSKKVHAVLQEAGVAHSIKQFFAGSALLESACAFDLLFLDIKMEHLDGLTTAALMRKRSRPFLLVFITAYREHVYDAFDVEAFHYLIKPVDDGKLAKVLLAVVDKCSAEERGEGYIVVTRNREAIKLVLDDVIYFEISGRVIKAHCNQRVLEYYDQISALEEKLNRRSFFRCHKSYLIHLKHVMSFDKNEILMDNGDKVLLSKRRHKEFMEALLNYVKKEGGIL